MIKRKRKQILIDNVLSLGKGEVVSSNLTGSTIFLTIIKELALVSILVATCIYAFS